MKEIPLKNSEKKVIVDDIDYDLVMKYNWVIGGAGYAQTGGSDKTILLHRLIMNAGVGQEVDHKDGDRLNCIKTNLRFCTHSQNIANDGAKKNNKLGIKGVDRVKATGKYRATIRVNYKKIHIGNFATAKEAARAWNEEAKKHFGEFAYQNDLERIPC